ncbi:cytoplasmic protein [Escherichia coli]|uniref:cytoplasmic protein n=1 Tax=Escherichia coli TaxID=562 RepID=UPI000D138B04|nr:cytoplasmic protein [Escherichia coli]EED1925207.1 cytoplasmic protein [Escherichia coli]EEU3018703.1 cytoplasmic protein [Escherichia coli]EEX5382135.1 cytoplasmic protein [Escherichia coli]EFK6854409.1 cytoplasmic protein [Escherichia coli]EFL3921691.1 cytoplasmic protein [Escherichia coli]
MSTLFTINACKSFGCRNLGQPTSTDYSWPDYRLGYPALHCRACGSYPPLFDEQQFRDWLTVHLSTFATEKGHFCPVCYGTETICYGHNPQGSQRIQCRNCKKVWTPKQYQKEITPPEIIETVAFLVPFQGVSSGQKLYVLISFDALRGNILHLSTNYTQHQAGESLHYRYRGNAEPELHDNNIVQRVDMREAQFLRRSQFDEIQYGSAALKRNAKGIILRPVITAHVHFRVLNILFPTVKTHVISHECFLRGAIITAWAELFRQQQGEIWFIEEEIADYTDNTPWRFQGTTYHGWWKNQWQLWGQGKNRKMVCALTGGNNSKAEMLSFATSRHFIDWLHKQAVFTHSTPLSAGRVTQILLSLAQDYNNCASRLISD